MFTLIACKRASYQATSVAFLATLCQFRIYVGNYVLLVLIHGLSADVVLTLSWCVRFLNFLKK